ncbi:MAG: MoaD/ThiS family protein [Thiotrichaceae bacterium]
MAVTVKFFASLRELVGKSEVNLDLSQPLSVAQIWMSVCAIPFPEHILTAINLEYVERETLVHDGDEIAFFPPVTGG